MWCSLAKKVVFGSLILNLSSSTVIIEELLVALSVVIQPILKETNQLNCKRNIDITFLSSPVLPIIKEKASANLSPV